MSKSQKIMVKLYLQETKDSDLIERLDSLPTYMRNDLIKDALRYYIANIVDMNRGQDKDKKETEVAHAKKKNSKFTDPISETNFSFNL